MPANPKDETEAQRSRRVILAAIRAVPRGQVAGYGEIARRAGLPGRARLVARVLSAGDEPGLPWHRVLRSDGRVAFPEGSSGYDEQVQRLRAEGVRIEGGRVRGQRAAATLDEMLWAPPEAASRKAPAKKARPAAEKALAKPARPAAKKALAKPARPAAKKAVAKPGRPAARTVTPRSSRSAAAAGTRRRR